MEPPPVATAEPALDAAREPPAQAETPTYRIGSDEPLRAGRAEWSGMVRPTKGGLDLRGVTFTLEMLDEVLVGDAPSYDDLLGAELRVVADLEERVAAEPGGEHVQSRGGSYFAATALLEAEVVERPAMIEGQVARSKGFFAVGGRLVRREDLAWALRDEDPMGKRVRLWGQPRVHHCAPQEQCLREGSLPLFDVGRAELAPAKD